MTEKKLSNFPSGSSFYSIHIDDIAFPNDYGVGKVDGYVLFVPGALPGDRVKVEIVKRGERFGYGKIVSIEEPSPSRVTPLCPHFGPCGGCTLQNMAYDDQLLIKERYLRETLKRIGGTDTAQLDMLPITPSPLIHFYRSKLELAFGQEGGNVILGLRQRVSPFEKYGSKVVPLERCVIFSPLLEKIIPIFTDYAHAHHLVPYNPLTRQGSLRHLILREAKSSGDIMVILEATRAGALPDMIKIWQALTDTIPHIKSFFGAVNGAPSDVIRFEKVFPVGGRSFIEEEVASRVFRIYPQSFFQPNPKSAELLYRQIPVLASLRSEETVLGLYCGIGPIEISLSPFVKKVTGIDSLPQNITNAVENCRLNERLNCFFFTGAVEDLHHGGLVGRPDILVFDPPRGGLTKKALRVIMELRPPKLIYISCNPSTLARDLKLFLRSSYAVKKIAPFDFFPHTSHLETFVYLQNHL